LSNRIKLTAAFVRSAKLPVPPKDRIFYWDQSKPGFGLMVTNKGRRSFVVQYRVGTRTRRMHLDSNLTLEAARTRATELLGVKAAGRDPLEEKREKARAADDTFRSISAEYVKQAGRKLRSISNRESILKRQLLPKLGGRPIGEIKRSELARLFDKIEGESGASAADFALAVIRRIFSWHAARSDDFRSPIVRGMARTKPKELARQRVLSDDEIRAVWAAAEADTGVFGPYVQFLLLTAARRTEASHMARAELKGAVWTIPEKRYKTGLELVLPLSETAQRVLERLPKIGEGRYVFTVDGVRPFSGYSRGKTAFDSACGVTDWHLHDLRRTARSLMSRAGVDANVAERALGHVIAGVRATYDRHAYFEEKRRAFEVLATLIERILARPGANVVPLKRDPGHG
jgi:integrase